MLNFCEKSILRKNLVLPIEKLLSHTKNMTMLQQVIIQFLFNYLLIGCLWRLKTKENFKFLALKAVITRGFKVSDFTWKILVFWKLGCWREVVATGYSTVLFIFRNTCLDLEQNNAAFVTSTSMTAAMINGHLRRQGVSLLLHELTQGQGSETWNKETIITAGFESIICVNRSTKKWNPRIMINQYDWHLPGSSQGKDTLETSNSEFTMQFQILQWRQFFS